MTYYIYKFKREINRIFQQFKTLIEFFYEPFLRWKYDKYRSERLIILDGAVCLKTSKVALFLIYQPNGLAPSIHHTCAHFIEQGYLPLVISNSALSSSDLNELKQHAWKILIRPNFGYDFGGYRDGIWFLNTLKLNPDFLIVINDSIWFPIFHNDKTIERMENAPAAFVGALQIDQSRSVNRRRFKHPFMGSFFWLLKKDAIINPAFQSFWSSYKMTSNKYKTIRRGERLFSHVMADAHVKSHAMFNRGMLDEYVMQSPAAQLLDILRNLSAVDNRLIEHQQQCIHNFKDDLSWSTEAREVIFKLTDKQNILASAPVITIQNFGVSYIKKSGEFANIIAIKKIKENIESGKIIGVIEVIIQEMGKTSFLK